ncbi:hypothetical protein DUZ99_11185 [Xylanibacillus composti]|uniref:Bacterial spore germination immunoglobulin-like domain-containing protein n=1 Tax=Xylanibacillus composti TaxID=1572762 RepID=A0A8J4H2Q3_9BACL|nr:Gmad2 immunoglobulin-like domain-containing protein [Xylanibacillus composti]MDT9725534.1 hypothetical protein [Xylanibacillus composti]GIQ67628.1 hypothetical protein XYCOK13_04520 [Xylanibacillus composti]
MKSSFTKPTMRGTLVMMAIVLGLMLTVSACQPKANSTDSNHAVNAGNEPQDVGEPYWFWTEKGYVVAKEGNRWLITAYETSAGGEPHKQAGWFTVNEKTRLQSETGRHLDPEAIPIGSRVQIAAAGEIAESYPVQGAADEIVRLGVQNDPADEQAPDRTHIAEADAVRIALQHSQEQGLIGPWYIVKTVFDEADYQWLVQLAGGEDAAQVETVVTDAASGKVIEKPVAENAAFRVYEPQANAVIGGKLTVRGDARVFEGAFGWRLEDGHFVLEEGHVMAEAGAPEWGSFRFEVELDRATNPVVMLVLYEASAKDGSPRHELMIPLQADPSIMESVDGIPYE